MTYDGQADSELETQTNQHSFFPSTMQQPQKLQRSQGAMALLGATPENRSLKKAIRY